MVKQQAGVVSGKQIVLRLLHPHSYGDRVALVVDGLTSSGLVDEGCVGDVRSFAFLGIAIALIFVLGGGFVRNIEFSRTVCEFRHVSLSLQRLLRRGVIVVLSYQLVIFGEDMRLFVLSKYIDHGEKDQNNFSQNYNV